MSLQPQPNNPDQLSTAPNLRGAIAMLGLVISTVTTCLPTLTAAVSWQDAINSSLAGHHDPVKYSVAIENSVTPLLGATVFIASSLSLMLARRDLERIQPQQK